MRVRDVFQPGSALPLLFLLALPLQAQSASAFFSDPPKRGTSVEPWPGYVSSPTSRFEAESQPTGAGATTDAPDAGGPGLDAFESSLNFEKICFQIAQCFFSASSQQQIPGSGAHQARHQDRYPRYWCKSLFCLNCAASRAPRPQSRHLLQKPPGVQPRRRMASSQHSFHL